MEQERVGCRPERRWAESLLVVTPSGFASRLFFNKIRNSRMGFWLHGPYRYFISVKPSVPFTQTAQQAATSRHVWDWIGTLSSHVEIIFQINVCIILPMQYQDEIQDTRTNWCRHIALKGFFFFSQSRRDNSRVNALSQLSERYRRFFFIFFILIYEIWIPYWINGADPIKCRAL